jgi:hypothetical protein
MATVAWTLGVVLASTLSLAPSDFQLRFADERFEGSRGDMTFSGRPGNPVELEVYEDRTEYIAHFNVS